MDMQTAKAITEQMGLTWKGDFIDALSEEERNAGYIKFNIPDPETPENLNGEGVWGWLTPDDKKKYDDDSFTGKLPVILCNDPLNYFGRLFAGQEVIVRCTGATGAGAFDRRREARRHRGRRGRDRGGCDAAPQIQRG